MRDWRKIWASTRALLESRPVEGIGLLLARLALAGIFWRSGRSKVEDGSWFQPSDSTRYLFETDYSGIPLPPELAVHLAIYSETLLPVLLVAGLATRASALALAGMTMVIQIFVFPEAWWSVHIGWMAMALLLVSRGSGLLGIDALLAPAASTRRFGEPQP